MNARPITPDRRGFSAVELLIVLAVIAVLTSMSLPPVLSVLREASVQNGAAEVKGLWQSAQAEARSSRYRADHYGVAIVQDPADPAGAWAAVIKGDSTSAPAAMLLDAANRVRLNPSVVVMVAGAGGGEPQPLDGALIWYAQYGSGLPIAAAAVAAGDGEIAPPLTVGAPSFVGGGQVVSTLRFQSLDADLETGRGVIYELRIYPAGISLLEELKP